MSFSQPFPLFQSPISSPAAAAANRRVARAPPGTKTARHGRTNMLQDRTEKVPNVSSEFLEKMSFSQPFPLFQSPISSPAAAAAPAAAAQKHLPAPKQPLLLLLPLLLLTEEQQKHLPAPKQQGTEGRTGPRIAPKKCLTSLLNS